MPDEIVNLIMDWMERDHGPVCIVGKVVKRLPASTSTDFLLLYNIPLAMNCVHVDFLVFNYSVFFRNLKDDFTKTKQ